MHIPEHCITCGQKIVRYRHHLDDLDVSTLRKIHRYVLEQKTYSVDVRLAGLTYSERSRVTQLRFHGLIAKARHTDGRHILSHWILTKRGADFLKGLVSVPKYVITQNNAVIGHEGGALHKRDFRLLDDFNPHWDYVEITNDDGGVRVFRPKQQQLALA